MCVVHLTFPKHPINICAQDETPPRYVDWYGSLLIFSERKSLTLSTIHSITCLAEGLELVQDRYHTTKMMLASFDFKNNLAYVDDLNEPVDDRFSSDKESEKEQVTEMIK